MFRKGFCVFRMESFVGSDILAFEVFCVVIDAKKPSVATIQGLALRGGLELVMVYGNDCLSLVVLCLVWKVWEFT